MSREKAIELCDNVINHYTGMAKDLAIEIKRLLESEPVCRNCGKTGEAAKLPHSCRIADEPPAGEFTKEINRLFERSGVDKDEAEAGVYGTWLMKILEACKIIDRLEADLATKNTLVKELSSQTRPCSPSCYHHQTHPCEKCGRINGYLPKVWQNQQLQEKLDDACALIEELETSEEKLEVEKNELEEVCRNENIALKTAHEKIEQLQAKLKAKDEALKIYGRHKASCCCMTRGTEEDFCDCGFEQALKGKGDEV